MSPPEDRRSRSDPHHECAAEIDRLRMELVTLHGAIDEMSIGVATKKVNFAVMPPMDFNAARDGDLENRQPTILHPDVVIGIMRAIREHALKMTGFGRSAIDREYGWDAQYSRGVAAGIAAAIVELDWTEDLDQEALTNRIMHGYYQHGKHLR